MKKYNNIAYFLIISILFFFGCEEKINWNYNTIDSGKLVVESIITDEYKNQEIVLSLSGDDINMSPIPVSGAVITVKEENQVYNFYEKLPHSGRYTGEIPFQCKLNKEYFLEIMLDNNIYRSKSRMVSVKPMSKITFKQINDNKYTFDQVPPLYSLDEQAMYEIDIDWSHIINTDSSKAKLFYFTFNTIDVNEIFRPGKQSVRFPGGSIVIVKKYSLNKQMADYFRAIQIEMEWQGGVLDEASDQLPTNISNGAFGLFGVSSVLTDTLIVK